MLERESTPKRTYKLWDLWKLGEICTLPETNNKFAPEKRPFAPRGNVIWTNHQFSGVMLVSGAGYIYIWQTSAHFANPIGSMGLVYLPTVHEWLIFIVHVGPTYTFSSHGSVLGIGFDRAMIYFETHSGNHSFQWHLVDPFGFNKMDPFGWAPDPVINEVVGPL